MATVKTRTDLTNVYRDANATINPKSTANYSDEFNGTEELKWQPEPFEAFGKTTRINSAALSSKIYNYFKQTFHDLRGCNIVPLPNNQFVVEMFFEKNTEPLTDGKIINLESLVNASGSTSNLFEAVQVTQNRMKGKMWTLNDDTKLLLSKYMYGGEKANQPDNKKVWGTDAILKEVHIPAVDPFRRTYGTDRVFVRVSGFDIRRIVQEIYGRDIVTRTVVDENGDTNFRSECRYEVRFVKYATNGTFIVNIEQFDLAAVEKMFVEENPAQQQFVGVQMYS